MNNIIDLTGSDGEEESKSIETTLKQIPPYIHDGYAVEYADNDIDRIMSNIRQNGFCIVDNVLTIEECEELMLKFKDYIREVSVGLNPSIEPNDPTTWSSFKHLYPSNGMMLKHFKVCDSDVLWSVRQNVKVASLWSKLHSTVPNDLLVSFDGGSWHPAPEHDPLRKRAPSVLKFQYHIDDNVIYDNKSVRDFDPRSPDDCMNSFKSTVQGIVLIEDIDEGDSTLDCLKGAHRHHYELCQRFINDFKYPKKDWQKLSDEMVGFYLNKAEVERVRLMAKRGSIFLFVSQLPHNVCQPVFPRNNPKDRMVAYVCYYPRDKASEKQLKKKREAFEDGCGTSHHPIKVIRNGKYPNTWGKGVHESLQNVTITKPTITSFGKRLSGF